jgi:hypothetical protein
MKLGRTILAPLFALALLLTQSLPFAATIASATQAGCGCHRAVCCCCEKSSDPDSAPRPATPVRTVAQNDLQIVAAVEQILFAPLPPQPSYFHASPSQGTATIPLYRRDCVLLI